MRLYTMRQFIVDVLSTPRNLDVPVFIHDHNGIVTRLDREDVRFVDQTTSDRQRVEIRLPSYEAEKEKKTG